MTLPDEHADAVESPKLMSVTDILKGLKVLKDDSTEDAEVPLGKSAADTFLTIVKDPANASACVQRIFPESIPLDQSFFDRLDEFRRWIGIGDSGDEAIGIVWSEAMRRLSVSQQQQLLRAFAEQKGHDFFENVGSLHVVVKDHSLPASFLADWFTDLVRVVERDISVDVWKAITALCQTRIDCAMEVMRILVTTPVERRLNMTGVMLGTLRGIDLTENQETELKRIEDSFKDHTDEAIRAVYDWSWSTTAWRTGITEDQICSLFSRAENGDESDVNRVMSVICRIIIHDALPLQHFRLCVDWITSKLDSKLTSTTKYYIANAANNLERVDSDRNKPKMDWSSWILGVQPVSKDEDGTWNQIQWYLHSILKQDPVAFCDVFERLCKSNSITLNQIVPKGKEFDSLLHEMEKHDLAEMIGRLAMSPDTATRRLGIFLFDKLGIESLPDESFAPHGGLGMRVLFYETQRTIIDSHSLARLFVSMLRHLDFTDDDFKNELIDELKLQSRNFARGCRQVLEERGGDLPIVIETLKSVAKYFEELKRAHDAGINAMEVPGHRRASTLHRRRFSQQVSQHAERHSPFLSMFKQVRLLYGRASSTFINGKLQKAIPFTYSSSSIEIPIVDFCDPEEMASRRLHALIAIQRLLGVHGIDSQKEDTDE